MNDNPFQRSGKETIIVVGHARLPQSLSPVGASVILIELEVGLEDGLVAAVHLSGFLPGACNLLSGLLVGKHMQRDFDSAIDQFHLRYIGSPQRAIATALNNARESYQRYLRQGRFEPFFSPSGGAHPEEQDL